jgi:diguanylate cyclase (GGDEF)-like protein/PAS domain S-box-containing protein
MNDWNPDVLVLLLAVVLAVALPAFIFSRRGAARRKAGEGSLRAANDRLENVLEATRTGIWEWNVPTGSLVVNEEWALLVGHTLEELAPISIDTFYRLLHPDDSVEVDRQLAWVFAREQDFFDIECRMRHKGGHWVWIRNRGRVTRWTDEGKPLFMFGSHADISIRKQSELDQKTSEDRYGIFFALNRDSLFVLDRKTGDILDVNEATCETYGYTRDELLHMNSKDVSAEPERTMAAIESMDTRFTTIPLRYHRKKDGTIFPVEISASQFPLGERPTLLVSMRDITARVLSEERILEMSYRDELTGLYNRRFYEAELDRLDTLRNLPLSFLMGDVNGLKHVNDTAGHLMGDQLLCRVASVLHRECRSDDIVARIGGDEFAILLPRTSALDAEQMLHRIRSEFEAESSDLFDLSIAFGLATKSDPAQPFPEVFKTAEDAMYADKQASGVGRSS